jgi:hypothetical protein
MRAYPGKTDCLLIDHAGCVTYHGFPDVDREWPIDPNDNIDKRTQKKRQNEPSLITCAQCLAVFSGSRTCPECGHIHAWVKQPKDYAKKNGTLVEVKGGSLPPEVDKLLKQRFWHTCIGTSIKCRKHAGMAAGMFSSKFGEPPWKAGVTPLPDEAADWQRPSWEVFPGFGRRKKSEA